MIKILHIAIPCPLRQIFDYLSTEENQHWTPGLRVKVPFGSRELIGIVLRVSEINPNRDVSKLKPILEQIDSSPILNDELFNLINWVSAYYHHPIGDCFQAALPKKLRHGETAELKTETFWYEKKRSDLTKLTLGKKQDKILTFLKQHPKGLSQRQIKQQLGECKSSLLSLETKGFIHSSAQPKLALPVVKIEPACNLNEEQQIAVDTVWQNIH